MFDSKIAGGKNGNRTGLARHKPKLKDLLLASVTAGLLATAAQEARADLTWYTIDNTTSSVQTVGLNVGNLANYQLTDPSALEAGPVQYPWTGVTFTATESGSFYFGQTSSPTDTVMIFYNGVFDPTRPGYGAIVGNDDTPVANHQALVGAVPIMCGAVEAFCPQIKADIVAGHTYTLFISVFNPVTGVALPLTFYSTASVAFGPYTGRNPIDLDAPFYLSSQLGIRVDPDFVGGTLKMDEEGKTYSQGFTVAHIDSSTIEMNGTNTVFTGAFSDATTSPQGHITFKDSVGGGSVTFSGANTYTGTTTLASGLVKAGATNVFATSSRVTVASGARLDMNGYNQSVNQLAGGGTIALGSGTLTANGAVDYSGLITGSGNLVINAGGKLYGASDYSGGTTVRSGTLQAYNSAALGAGVVTVDAPAILELNTSSGNLSVGNVINGSGALNTSGAGTVTLTASNTSVGTVNVGGGGLVLAQNGAFNANTVSVASGSTLKINNTAQLNTAGLFQQNAPNATLTVEMNGRTGAAINASTASLNGTLNIAGLSTGGTVARASDVASGPKTVIHTTGGITGDFTSVNLGGAGSSADYLALSAGKSTNGMDYNVGFGLAWLAGPTTGHGTFTLTNSTDAFDVDIILANQAASATGWDGKSLTKAGAGTLTLSRANTYDGDTNVNGGTLKAGIVNAFARSANVAIATGTTLDLNNFNQTANNLSGGGSVKLGSAALTVNDSTDTSFSGVVSGVGSLTKTGAGTLTLSGVNTYTGNTNINGGTLKTGVANVFASSEQVTVSSGAKLDLNGFDQKAGKLSGAGAVDLGSATLTVYVPLEFEVYPIDTDYNFSGVISGTGRLVKTGEGDSILSGNNTYSGGTTIREGTLRANNGNALGTGDVTMDFLSRLLLNFSEDATLANKINGPGDLQKFGNGKATLTATGSSAGLVSAERGTLIFAQNGVFTADDYFTASNATTTINSSAQLKVNNGIMQVEKSTLNIDAAGRTNAAITATTASLDGTLNVTGFSGGSTAAKASELLSSGVTLIHTTGGISGDFASVNLGGAGSTVDYLALSAGKSADDMDYNVGFGLSWLAGPTTGHGTFTLTNSADAFDVDVVLADQAASTTGWDGTTLTKAGAGTLTLSGENTYSGGSTISAGKVIATNGSSLGTGAVSNNAALELLFATDGTFANTLSGSGSLTKTGTGTATLTGAGSREGAVSVDAGTLLFGQAGAFDAASLSTASGATTSVAGNAKLSLSGALTQSSGATLSVAVGAAQPVITAATASLNGTLNVSGYAGSAPAKASELTDTQVQVIHTTGGITGDFASVNLGGAASPLDYLTVAGAKSTDNKDYNVGFGLSWLASADKAHGKFTIDSGSSFDVDVALGDRLGTFVGWSGTTLTKAGAGTLILSAQNTYTGPTYISAGTLKMGVADAFASSELITLAGGTTLDLNDFDQRAHELGGAGDIKLGSATLTIDMLPIIGTPPVVLSGTISGTGSLVKEGQGMLTLSGVNSYSGGTTISDGALVLRNGNAAGTGDIVGSGELILAFDTNSTLANKLQGVDLDIDRSASATLTAANSSVGVINNYRSSLTLAMSGALAATRATNDTGSTLTIGANSSLRLTNDFRNVSDAILNVAIGSLTQPAITANTASLAGSLNITGFSGHAAASASGLLVSQVTVIHTTNGITGDFSSATIGGAGSSVDYLTLSAGKSTDGKDYNVGFGLSWLAGPTTGNGLFTLADGTDFDVDVVLTDQAASATGWDGKSLTKAGAGTLTLSRANTYDGDTNINGGTLKAGFTDAFARSANVAVATGATLDLNNFNQTANNLSGGGSVKLGSAALTVNDSTNTSFSGVMSGTGSLVKTGTGALTLSGENTYSGGSMISAGKVIATNGSSLGTGAVSNNAALELLFATDGTFANTLSGSGSLTKTGTGTATLTGAGSREGAVSVDAGTLLFGQAGAFDAASLSTASGATTSVAGNAKLSLSGALTQSSGATLSIAVGAAQPAITAATASLNGTLNVSGFSGNGTVAKASELLSNGVTLIHTTGGISGDFSSVTIGGASSPVDYLTLSAGKSADSKDYNVGFGLSWLAGATTGKGTFTLAGGTDFDVDVVLADQAESATGWDGKTLTKAGAGTLTLSSVNTYTGITEIREGVLKTGVSNAVAESAGIDISAGAVFDLNGYDQQITILYGQGTAKLGSNDLTIKIDPNRLPNAIPHPGAGPIPIYYYGQITGTGGVTIENDSNNTIYTLTGNSDYSGGTRILTGTVALVNGNALGTGAVTNNAALQLNFATNGTFANTLSGTGSLAKKGTGTATLTGAGSRAGAVSVDAGTLLFGQSGAFDAASLSTASGATTSVAADAKLVLSGALTQNAGSTLSVAVGTAQPEITAATASLAGRLNVSGYAGSAPAQASALTETQFQVIHTTGGITGDFASVDLGGATSPLDYLTVAGGKSADGKDYNIGFDLSWLAGTGKGHGTFTLADGAGFDVDVDLADRAASATGWDGKTLTKDGAGTLTLSSQNTYTGITDIRAGTLKMGVANAVASSEGIEVYAGAVFDLNGYDQQVNILYGLGTVNLGSNNLAIKIDPNHLPSVLPVADAGTIAMALFTGPQITGTGSVTIENGWSDIGTYVLSGNSDYSGGTNIVAGKVGTTNGHALGTGGVSVNASAELQLRFSDDDTFANVLSGDGSLVKQDGGTATLTGSGSSVGHVSVIEGALAFAQSGAFDAASLSTASGATTSVAADAKLVLSGALTQNAGSTLSVAVGTAQPAITAATASLAGRLNVSGYASSAPAQASALTETQFQVIHTTGGITGDFASVDLGGATSPLDYLTVAGGKSADGKDYNIGFDLSWLVGTEKGHGTFTLAGGTDFDVDVDLADQAASATGWDGKTLTKDGAGTLTLSYQNTYTGDTLIRNGTVKADVADVFASSANVEVASGATLDLNGLAQTANNLSGAGDVKLGSAVLTVNDSTNTAFSGVMSGTGSLTKTGTGTFTLSGANTYSGGSTLSEGKVVAITGAALGTGAVANNASLELAFADNDTFANTLSGSGALTKTGSGEATLTGSGSSAGSVDVREGVLNLAQNGTFTAGSYTTQRGASTMVSGAAKLNVAGSLVQEADSTLVIALNSLTAPAITATSADLAGNLQITGFTSSAAAKASHLLASRMDVIHTTDGIAGDFDSVSFGLHKALGSDYTTLTGWKSDDGRDYSVGFGLTWQAGASKAHGMFNIVDASDAFEVDVPLADRVGAMDSGWDGKSLTKMGAGTLILSAANTYTGGTTLAGGTVQVSSDANLGAATGKLTFEGGTLATTESFTSSRAVALQGDGTLDVADGTVLTLAGALAGSGGLSKTGTGTLALDGSADYSGDTVIGGGRVEAMRANVLSAASGHTVSSGAALVLNGYDQTVASLSNAGEVRIGVSDGSRAGATLTVAGTYVSNGGSLFLNTVLGSDDSATDKLVTGSVEMASAATKVFIANAGGFGDYTNANGIEIIQVGDASQSAAGAFVLGGRVAAGAYDYHLFQGGIGSDANDGNWYLRNQRPEDPMVPDIRPEVPLAMAIPPLAIEYGYALLDTRHQRFAETSTQPAQLAYEERTVRCNDKSQNYRCVIRTPVAPAAADRAAYGAWGRIFGTRGTQDKNNFLRHGPDFDYTFGGGQVGFDVYARDGADGHLDRAGVYVSYGQISSDVKGVYGGKAGTVDMDAYSVAGYWTHQAPEGWYTDAVVQGTWYSADARSVLGQQVKPDGFGVVVSAEGGYAYKLGDGLSIEPQAQVVYQVVSFDDVRDSYGFASFDKGDSLRGRIGARLAKSWDMGEGNSPRLITGWIRANLWHEFLGDGRTLITDLNGANPARFGSPLRGTWAEIGAGVSGQVSDSTSLFLNGAYNRSVDNKGREAWDGRVGVNVKW